MEKNVTVGILFNNEYKDIDNLFKSLHSEADYIKEIKIVSNKASNICRLENIMAKHVGMFCINVMAFNINTGCAGGRNKLIKYCRTKYMLICDADLEVTKGLVKTLLDTLGKYKEAYAVVPKMYFGGTNLIWWAGGYDKHQISGICKPDSGLFDNIAFGGFVGTCGLINVKKFIDFKMWFDPEFFIYHEDVDIMKYLDDGIYGLYQPAALAYHNVVVQVTGKYFDIFRNYMTFRNRLITAIRHKEFLWLPITCIHYITMIELPSKLKLRAILYGIKIGLFKLFSFYKGKIIDSKEYKFVHKFSINRLILR